MTYNSQILIIDDEPAIAQVLRPVLETQNYAVQVTANAAEALRCARQVAFDIVLLDLALPDADGKEIISRLRALNCKSILVLSARHQESEKVAALDEGADDYLDKPFGIDELLARIRSALRRNQYSTERISFTSKKIHIDYNSRRILLHGREIKLSPKEFCLLEVLSRHAGQVVTRRQLLLAGWNNPTVDSQGLRTYIAMLRQKIEMDPGEPKIIITEAGVGYRFVEVDLS